MATTAAGHLQYQGYDSSGNELDHNKSPKPFRFMSLPYDLRCIVYEVHLIHDRNHVPLYHRVDPILRVASRPRLGVNILRTSKQVYEEAVKVLYSRNVFGIAELVRDPSHHGPLSVPYSTEVLNTMGGSNRALIHNVEVLLMDPSDLWRNDSPILAQLLPNLEEATLFFTWDTHFTYDSGINWKTWLARIATALRGSPASVGWDFRFSTFKAEAEPPQQWRSNIHTLVGKQFPNHDLARSSLYWERELYEERMYSAACLALGKEPRDDFSFWPFKNYITLRGTGKHGQQYLTRTPRRASTRQMPQRTATTRRNDIFESASATPDTFPMSAFCRNIQHFTEPPLAHWNDPPMRGTSEDSEDESLGYNTGQLRPWMDLLHRRARTAGQDPISSDDSSAGSAGIAENLGENDEPRDPMDLGP